MSVPVAVPKRSGKHLLRRFGQSGIRNWESYSSNSTTSPFLARLIMGLNHCYSQAEFEIFPTSQVV